ncbi:MAG: hypothetical protein L3J41_13190 [Melioribacteraceae bacterium]|nr:hypothetical protein [Melioribacteraceae bacterium]
MKRIIILTTAVLLVISSALNAQPGMGSSYGNRHKQVDDCSTHNIKAKFGAGQMNRLEKIKVLLKLSAEQEAKVSDIKFEHDNIVLDVKNKIAKNRLLVRKMMTDNKVDQKKLLSLSSTNSELHGKLGSSKIKMWLEIYNILDDTQKEQWTKMFLKMGQKGKHNKNNFRKGEYGEFPKGRMR